LMVFTCLPLPGITPGARFSVKTTMHARIALREPARLIAVIYEPLLYRRVGPPETMTAEMEHLLEDNGTGPVLRVTPADWSRFTSTVRARG